MSLSHGTSNIRIYRYIHIYISIEEKIKSIYIYNIYKYIHVYTYVFDYIHVYLGVSNYLSDPMGDTLIVMHACIRAQAQPITARGPRIGPCRLHQGP